MKKQNHIRLFLRKVFILNILFFSFACTSPDKGAQDQSAISEQDTYYRDLYPDTWVATDALGRTMPDIDSVGPVKRDHRRVVGMFYITWHTPDKANLK
ncbi:MAG: hypothetical protein KAT15_25810, partial [Bacteroidales bacterium]|nr:hypothetical protein [Bacteroidales bacterium]